MVGYFRVPERDCIAGALEVYYCFLKPTLQVVVPDSKWHDVVLHFCRPGDVVIYPASTALGFYLIHSRTHDGLSASGSPFLDFNSTFDYLFAAVLGHLVYRICSLAVMPMQRRYKMDIVHYLAATAVYVVILVKREDAILGAVGMLPWAPLAFLSLRRATKMADCLAFPHWVASVTWAMTSPLFMLVVPTAYLIDSMVHNSVEDMSIVSIGTFCFALAYFGLAFLAHVIRAMMKVFCFVSPEQPHEGSSLLFTRGSSNTGNNNVEEATAGQPNTWIRGSFNNYFLDASKNGEVPFAKEESRPSEPGREDC